MTFDSLDDMLPAYEYVGAWVGEDGRIVSELKCSRGLEVIQKPRAGCRLIEGRYNADTTYFIGDIPTERPQITEVTEFTIAGNGVDEIVLPMPNETEVRVDYKRLGFIDDGSFEFVSTKAGTHVLDFYPPFPFQEQSITVIVNAV